MSQQPNKARNGETLIAKCLQDHFLGELVNSMLRRSDRGKNNNNNVNNSSGNIVSKSNKRDVPVDVAVGNLESMGFQVGQKL